MKDKTVSLVITSCDRFDLLEETLKSFFYFNTYPLNQIIVIEDSGKEKELKNVLNKFKQDFTILINKDKLGQLRSIDKAYSYVESEYIFHCEDDWEFNKYSFIEKSLNILNENSKILSVWIRSIEEFSKIKFSDNIYKSNTNESYKLVYNEILTFNPSLRRISDYKELCSYSQFELKNFEYEISEYYLNKGFVSAILIDPCVNHLGWHRRVANINKNKSKIGYWLDSKIKKMKAKFYKRFSLGKFKNK